MPYFSGFSGSPKKTWAVTIDPANINANTLLTMDVTLPGLRAGMLPVIHMPALEAGLVAWGRYKAKDTLELRILNTTASAVNPAAQTLFVAAL